MKYLQSSFTIERPVKVTCCEQCVYERGPHADWCPVGRMCLFCAKEHDEPRNFSCPTRFTPRRSSLMRIFKGC